LIDTVQTEIDPTQNNGEGLGLAPIGHVVTVVTAEPVTVDIQTTVTLDGVTWASVKQDVIDSLEAYFLGLRMSTGFRGSRGSPGSRRSRTIRLSPAASARSRGGATAYHARSGT